MANGQNNSFYPFGIQPPSYLNNSQNIPWETLYHDPQERERAKARYEVLAEQQQNLLVNEKDNQEELNLVQKTWTNIASAQARLNEQANKIAAEMQRLTIGQTPSVPIEQQGSFAPTMAPRYAPANEKQPAPPEEHPKVKQAEPKNLEEQLAAAKKKEEELRVSPTATAGDLAVVQQEIKDLEKQLNK